MRTLATDDLKQNNLCSTLTNEGVALIELSSTIRAGVLPSEDAREVIKACIEALQWADKQLTPPPIPKKDS